MSSWKKCLFSFSLAAALLIGLCSPAVSVARAAYVKGELSSAESGPGRQAADPSEINMPLCGVQPYAQGGALSMVEDPSYEGSGSLKATGRAQPWEGAAWNIPAGSLGELAEKRLWTFSMQAQSMDTSMDLTYNFEFWYSGREEKNYKSVTAQIGNGGWTRLAGTFEVPQDWFVNLDHIVIYPQSREGQLSDYCLAEVSLVGVTVDDMSLCGAAPYAQGGAVTLSAVNEPVYEGNSSLRVSGRAQTWEGAAWSIPAGSLGELVENRLWTFSMQARSADGEMDLTYNLEFWYSGNGEKKYKSVNAHIGNSGWTLLSGDFEMTDEYLSNLTHIVIYPVTGDGQFGDYYLDAVSLDGIPIGDMSICGVKPYAQGDGATIPAVAEPLFEGKSSMRATGRQNVWEGAAWNIPAGSLGELTGNRVWTLSMRAQSADAAMDLTYNLQFWYSGSSIDDCKYQSAAGQIGNGDWTLLTGTFEIPEEWFSDLDHIVIYPTTGEGQLGDYYIGSVSLTGVQMGDVTLCGEKPYAQGTGATLNAAAEPLYEGKASVRAAGRQETFGGAAWSISAGSLGELAEKRLWTFSMQAQSMDTSMDLTYNFEFWYSGRDEKNYKSVTGQIGNGGWTRLAGSFEIPEEWFSSLDHIVIYPTTGDGQLGDYYVGAVELTGAAMPEGDAVSPCGAGIYSQGAGVTLSLSDEPSYDGGSCIKVTGRQNVWEGAAWSIPASALGELTENRLWTISVDARADAEAMELTYNLEFWYLTRSGNNYQRATAQIGNSEWTALTGTFEIAEEWLSGLDRIVIYPTTGDGQLGDYYLGAVRLTGEPVPERQDPPVFTDHNVQPAVNMPLCGIKPYAQGERVSLSSDRNMAYGDNAGMKVAGRRNAWEGAAWSIPASSLGELAEKRLWVLSMQARGDEAMELSYNLEFWYSDNVADCKYQSTTAQIGTDGWTHLVGTFNIPEEWLENLVRVVIYPMTGEGQLGNYYLAEVSLTGTEAPEYVKELEILGAEPYAQGEGVTLSDAEDAGLEGQCVKVAGRQNIWEGAAWNIPASSLGELAEKRLWMLSMQARGDEAMELSYNLEFWYSDNVADCKYQSTTAQIGSDGWTRLVGTFNIPEEWLVNLVRVVIYPLTGEGQLGNYYLAEVSLTGTEAPEYVKELEILGAEPYAQGEGVTLSDAEDAGFEGQCVKVAGRQNIWEGAAWSIPASSLGELVEKRLLVLSMQARSDEAMELSYNLEFWYSDNVADCKYQSTTAQIGPDGWTHLVGTFNIPEEWLENLDHVVIYPMTGDGQLGNYYLAEVSLTGEPAPKESDGGGSKPSAGKTVSMPLCGVQPYAQGDSVQLSAAADPEYKGGKSLKVSGRRNVWEGAAWSIPAASLGTLAKDLQWTLSVEARSEDETDLTYNLEFWYSEDVADCKYLSASARIGGGSWTTVLGVFEIPGAWLEGLERVVVYPTTGEGQLGDYYIGAASLTGEPARERDDMTVGGESYFVHGDGVLTRDYDVKYQGLDSIRVSNRTLAYSGAGWDVTELLRNGGWGNYFFHAYARAKDEPMMLHYCVYLRFEDGTEDWLQPPAMYYITPDEWRPVNTDYAGGDALLRSVKGMTHDFSKLEQATLYPCTKENELGDYYLDDVSLRRGPDEYEAPTFQFDSFPLDGDFEEPLDAGAPGHLFTHGEGARLERTEEDSYSGSFSLKVSDQQSSYSGAGWVVTDYLKQVGWGDWYFTCFAKSEGGEVLFLQYSIYLQFDDGTEKWLSCGLNSALSSRGWLQVNTDTAGNPAVLRPTDGSGVMDFEHLTYAVLYPNLDSGMGTYYIDGVRLWCEKATEPEPEDIPPSIAPPPAQDNTDTVPEEHRSSGVWIWAAGAAAAAVAAGGVGIAVWRGKRRGGKGGN